MGDLWGNSGVKLLLLVSKISPVAIVLTAAAFVAFVKKQD